jgi:hypothetical protein
MAFTTMGGWAESSSGHDVRLQAITKKLKGSDIRRKDRGKMSSNREIIGG